MTERDKRAIRRAIRVMLYAAVASSLTALIQTLQVASGPIDWRFIVVTALAGGFAALDKWWRDGQKVSKP